ncbi:MAG: hypothetical protein E6G68_01125 [Actinobacteria bacterium]|nr:MAG: hypothetical protein E6G68_01125 [Actinomycetota bacterium]
MLRRFPAILAILLLVPLPALAQPSDDVAVRLISFSGWAATDRPLQVSIEVRNAGATPLGDVRAGLTIRERVRSRSALRASLDGNPSTDVLAVTTEQLDGDIAPGAAATIPIERDLGSLATSFRAGRAVSGVYPMTLSVQAGGRQIVQRFTAFVFLASPPETPLNMVWIVPVHRPLAADAGGVYDRAAVARELLPNGRIASTIAMLAAHQTTPLTLAPTGSLGDQLEDLANGFPTDDGKSVPATDPLARSAADLLARLRAAMSSPAFEIATATYSRASIPFLDANGLSPDAGRQLAFGRERVTKAFGRAPDPSLFVDGAFGLDARSARTYAAAGGRILVLDPATVHDPVEGRFGPDRIVELHSSTLTFDGLVLDRPIRDRLELPSEDPVLTAMGVAAETAGSYFERPGVASGRMLVVATAPAPEPAVAGPLLDVLAQAPWLRIRTASNVDAEPSLRPSGDPQRLDVAPSDGGARTRQSRAARRQVDIFGRVLVKPSGQEELARLDRIVLASESSDYDRHSSTAISLARKARELARHHLDRIAVPPRRVTLTSRGGQVPVTIVNRSGYTIRLRVRLDSQKVTFPTGAARVIEVPGKERGTSLGTLPFALEARAAGSFPVVVRLETVDGDDVIGSGEILVRSTAVSAVTLMATAGGALFLLVAWARRALSRRPKTGSAA